MVSDVLQGSDVRRVFEVFKVSETPEVRDVFEVSELSGHGPRRTVVRRQLSSHHGLRFSRES